MNKKKIISIIVLIILIIVLAIIGITFLNLNNNLEKIDGKDAKALELQDGVTVEIKEMKDGKIYCLLKFAENSGIQQITYPNEMTIYANNRTSIAIDYVVEPQTTYEFIVVNGEGKTITRIVEELEYDYTAPEEALIQLNTAKVFINETIQATVTQQDLYSGIDITNCKYIVNSSSEKIGVDSQLWNDATAFTDNPQTIDITKNVRSEYYLHVLSIDNAGNKQETVSRKNVF